KRFGVSQEELAQRCGLKRSMVADIEAGRRKIQREAGAALWNALVAIKEEQASGVYPRILALQSLLTQPQESIARRELPSPPMTEHEELELLRSEVLILRQLAANHDKLIEAIQEYMAEQKADAKTAEIARLREELDRVRELHGQDLALIARLQGRR